MNKYQEALERVRSDLEDRIETDNILMVGRMDIVILSEACKKAKKYEEKETPYKPVRIYPPFGDNVPVKRYPKIFGCGVCGEQVLKHYEYCPKCGNRIDWGSENGN